MSRYVLLLSSLSLFLTACAPLPWQASVPRRDRLVHSPGCHCRFLYPSALFIQMANGDTSTEPFSLHTYDPSSGHHLPIPQSFADIGLAWQADFTGALYRASTRDRAAARRTGLGGYAATAYSRFTAGSHDGRLYEEHLYAYVPMLRRDYDLSLLATGSRQDLARSRRLFDRIRRSIVFFSPSALP